MALIFLILVSCCYFININGEGYGIRYDGGNNAQLGYRTIRRVYYQKPRCTKVFTGNNYTPNRQRVYYKSYYVPYPRYRYKYCCDRNPKYPASPRIPTTTTEIPTTTTEVITDLPTTIPEYESKQKSIYDTNPYQESDNFKNNQGFNSNNKYNVLNDSGLEPTYYNPNQYTTGQKFESKTNVEPTLNTPNQNYDKDLSYNTNVHIRQKPYPLIDKSNVPNDQWTLEEISNTVPTTDKSKSVIVPYMSEENLENERYNQDSINVNVPLNVRYNHRQTWFPLVRNTESIPNRYDQNIHQDSFKPKSNIQTDSETVQNSNVLLENPQLPLESSDRYNQNYNVESFDTKSDIQLDSKRVQNQNVVLENPQMAEEVNRFGQYANDQKISNDLNLKSTLNVGDGDSHISVQREEVNPKSLNQNIELDKLDTKISNNANINQKNNRNFIQKLGFFKSSNGNVYSIKPGYRFAKKNLTTENQKNIHFTTSVPPLIHDITNFQNDGVKQNTNFGNANLNKSAQNEMARDLEITYDKNGFNIKPHTKKRVIKKKLFRSDSYDTVAPDVVDVPPNVKKDIIFKRR